MTYAPDKAQNIVITSKENLYLQCACAGIHPIRLTSICVSLWPTN